ncbi:hypothetical protein [Streptomyces sp. NPDC051567]|uniref:hypothetical protein n=1 Tax=Streptomyces sp. NPDC051567 TaxID=3365660 RepID=UPI00378D263C
MGQRTTRDTTVTEEVQEAAGRKKLDLSVAQVAASSLATVAAALLASELGVYGTILGAGVVSVVATAGGPVIQHFFRRTGDQLRESARPGPRPPGRRAPAGAEPLPGGFGRATVHGTRGRRRRRTAALAGAVFALSLGALGTYEAVAGTSVSSDGATLFSGGTRTAPDHRPAPPAREPGKGAGEKGNKEDKGNEGGKGGAQDGTQDGDGGRSPAPGNSPGPPAPQDGGDRSPGPVPPPSGDPAPDPSTAPTTSVTPLPSAPPGSTVPPGPAPSGAGPRDGS